MPMQTIHIDMGEKNRKNRRNQENFKALLLKKNAEYRKHMVGACSTRQLPLLRLPLYI